EGSFTRKWFLGEGDSSTNTFFSKSYSSYDTFYISLFTFSDKACLVTAYDTVRVHPQSVPYFSLADSVQCFRDHLFDPDASGSSTPYEQIVGYDWNLGDGAS